MVRVNHHLALADLVLGDFQTSRSRVAWAPTKRRWLAGSPTFIGPASGQLIRMQAAVALLRLCSDPLRTQPSLLLCGAEWTSPRVPDGGGRLDSVASTFAEGLRRLRELCAQPPSDDAGARAAHTARTELLKVLEAAPVPWRRLSQAEGGAERRMIHASTAAPFPGVTETGVQ